MVATATAGARPYTADEDALIRTATCKAEFEAIAARLGRSAPSVVSRGRRLGMVIRRPVGEGERRIAAEMRAAGAGKGAIARALGVSRHRVDVMLGEYRTRLGRRHSQHDPEYDREPDAARRVELAARCAAATAWKHATGGLLVPRDFDAVVRAHRGGTLAELAGRLRRDARLYPYGRRAEYA